MNTPFSIESSTFPEPSFQGIAGYNSEAAGSPAEAAGLRLEVEL